MKVGIIGGGIVGSTAAYYLARQNIDVHLFDEGTGQATCASAGIIAPWFSLRRNQPWYYLVREGAELYPRLMQDLTDDGFPTKHIYQIDGVLMPRRTAKRIKQDAQQYEAKINDSPTIGELIQMNGQEAEEHFPLIQTDYQVSFVTGGGRVDGSRLINLLHEVIQHHGGYVSHTKAQLRDHQTIESNGTSYTFDHILLSVGAWLPELLDPLGYDVDIHPQKGQLVQFYNPAWKNQHWPVMMPPGLGDIIPFNDGTLIIGATHEDGKGFDLAEDPQALHELLEEANQWLKEEAQLNLEDAQRFKIGTRAMTSDYSVLVGEVPQLAPVWAISGLGSSGLTSGPYLGYQWAKLISQGEWDIPIDDYPIQQYIQKR